MDYKVYKNDGLIGECNDALFAARLYQDAVDNIQEKFDGDSFVEKVRLEMIPENTFVQVIVQSGDLNE
jgi:hypothetical protein